MSVILDGNTVDVQALLKIVDREGGGDLVALA